MSPELGSKVERYMANIIKEPCGEGVILSGKSLAPCAKVQGRWILAATILASSMAFIDGTVVNVALPALQKNLHATVIGVQWVVEGYSLFLSALLLVGGSLGDRYGRRFVFMIGVALFAIASMGCGLAGSINQLIAARAVQGVGAALLVPGSLAIISASFSPDQRGRAIGTWSAFSAITTAIGPVLGGWLVEHVSWRAVFFINVPIAAAVLLISLRHVSESRDQEGTGPLDWAGAVFATTALGGLVIGLIESSRVGFLHAVVVASLLLGVVSVFAFMFVEVRAQNPMLPLHLFRSRTFTGANLLTLTLYAAMSGTLFFLALNLIQIQKFSATAAGAAILPFVLIMFSLSRWSGGLVDRFGARLPLTFGPLLAAVGFALFTIPGSQANYWTTFFPAVVVLGFGMAVSVAPLTTTVMGTVPAHQAGVASGINNAVSRLAGLFAIAIFGVVMLLAFSRSLDRHLAQIEIGADVRHAIAVQRVKLAGLELPPNLGDEAKRQIERAVADSFVSGYRVIMMLAAGLALGSALSARLLIATGRGNVRTESGAAERRHGTNQPAE